MKKWLLMILACLMMAGTANAQTYSFREPEHSRAIYTCEDFEGAASDDARAAFADVLREDDEIICGTMIRTTWEGLEGEQNGAAVMAVRRGRQTLLMGALYDKDNKAWNAGVESDCFIPEDLSFTMTCMPNHSQRGVLRGVYPVILCEQETFVMGVSSGGMLSLRGYIRTEQDGTQTVADYDYGSVTWKTRMEGKKDVIYGDAGPVPARLCAWTYDTMPRTQAESQAWAAPFSFDLEADEGYLTGVNLRERPTGKSESYGIYRAKVKILGQQPGLDAPWHNVSVGNLEGWASGRYLKTEINEDPYGLAECQTTVSRVGRTKSQVQLLNKPDGSAISVLEEGTLVHVIMNHDGWLHVIVPRGELTWQTDWDGLYGFVKADEMTVGISKADAVWK